MEDTLKSLENAARLAGTKGLVRFTRFLDPAEAIQASQLARTFGASFAQFGGYEGAERLVGCFYADAADKPDDDAYPIVCLHSRFSAKFCSLTHRDLLGAFMSLGLTRSCIGDMIISEDNVYLFAHSTTADYIANAMTSAGKAQLHFHALEHVPAMPEPDGTRFSSVVSSLRLDAVLAAAYRLSRSEAQEAIRAGIVKVNHIPCERTDALVAENALLSLKGSGRIRLLSVDGMTRKQRIGITFFRYA